MIAVMLLMFVAGIGLTQAVSDPRQVTLRWLRLGGLIAISLLATAWLAAFIMHSQRIRFPTGLIDVAILSMPTLAQLMFVQLGWRKAQRLCALLALVVISCLPIPHLMPLDLFEPHPGFVLWRSLLGVATLCASSGLCGGFLMTMLLGHAYLTAGGEMTQKPFARLVKMLAILLLLRAVTSVAFGLVPWWRVDQADGMSHVWDVMMITARYLVGLVVPGVFTYMIYDCVKRRANQSATGILYVAGVMVIVGEGTALALLKATGFVF